jgi:soluble epoxide hydrolase/lipid-phosphate phosphatase
MDSLKAHSITHTNGQTTHYYEGGSADGTPLIFIHGWPDLAQTWQHQLSHFAQKSYRVIAPDMRGYGDSSAPSDKHAYSLEVLVPELVEFAEKLNIKKAVWVAHDWGCGAVNALAAHHPELFLGMANLAVAYRSVELGFDFLVSCVNRDIYPENEYEWGQWAYQRYYELHTEESMKEFEDRIELITKVLYTKHKPESYGKPSPLAFTMKAGGWFKAKGVPVDLPDIPLEYTLLDESLYANLLKSHKKHGFFPPTAWYLNHTANAEYAKSEKNGGVLEFPVLYIDAKYDAACSATTTPKFKEVQAEFVKDLTYETVDAGHWVQLEKPKEVIDALEKWLEAKISA